MVSIEEAYDVEAEVSLKPNNVHESAVKNLVR
jgi:hypothetical protein